MIGIEKLVLKIENPAKIRNALAASGPCPLRVAFDLDETVQKIVESKGEVGEVILSRIQNMKKEKIDDITLACFCYILEKLNYKKATPKIVDLLVDLIEEKDIVFSQHFAAHTIKILTGQKDLDLVNYAYSQEEIDEIITKFKASLKSKGR